MYSFDYYDRVPISFILYASDDEVILQVYCRLYFRFRYILENSASTYTHFLHHIQITMLCTDIAFMR